MAMWFRSLAAALVVTAGLPRCGVAAPLENYEINTTVEARVALTTIVLEVSNPHNCTLTNEYTLQLPTRARLESLRLDLSDDCALEGQVLQEAQAQEQFRRDTAAGRAAAIVEAYDMANYGVHVAVPPRGRVRVQVRYAELLRREEGRIVHKLPLSPGVAADRITAALTVVEPNGIKSFLVSSVDGVNLAVEQPSQASDAARAQLVVLDPQRAESVPREVEWSYDPGPLPEAGLLLTDALGHLVYLFNPPSVKDAPISRDLVFVIDVSGSMAGTKLSDAKEAFVMMIGCCVKTSDLLTVHSFSASGVESSFTTRLATPQNRALAVEFVRALEAGGGTNLNDAYLQGLAALGGHAKLPIVVMLTDGQASSGETNSASIVAAVTAANSAGPNAHIYGLAFGRGADLGLLQAVSQKNRGVTVAIYEGFGDAAEQMRAFVAAEIGAVLLRNVRVSLHGLDGADASSLTGASASSGALLANGSEIAVRGRTSPGSAPGLRATVTATGADGTTFSANATPSAFDLSTRVGSLGYAHDKIGELMKAAEGERAIGAGDEEESLHARALALALESGVVWPGLTAMVTNSSAVDAAACQAIMRPNTATPVCSDGSVVGASASEADFDTAAGGYGGGTGYGGSVGANAPSTYAKGSAARATAPTACLWLLAVAINNVAAA